MFCEQWSSHYFPCIPAAFLRARQMHFESCSSQLIRFAINYFLNTRYNCFVYYDQPSETTFSKFFALQISPLESVFRQSYFIPIHDPYEFFSTKIVERIERQIVYMSTILIMNEEKSVLPLLGCEVVNLVSCRLAQPAHYFQRLVIIFNMLKKGFLRCGFKMRKRSLEIIGSLNKSITKSHTQLHTKIVSDKFLFIHDQDH